MEEIIGILGSLCGMVLFFGLFLSFFAYLRYLRYKEVITLAEKGLVHPRDTDNGRGTLRWGIATTGLGVALCLGLYPLGWVTARGQFPLNFGPWMLVGLLPTFFGLSLVVIYLLTRRDEKSPQARLPEGADVLEEDGESEEIPVEGEKGD